MLVVKDKILILKAISDETRLAIIEFLMGGEQCACAIVPAVRKSQPNVSLHLKKLEHAGILESRKEGTRVLYRIKDESVRDILRLLDH